MKMTNGKILAKKKKNPCSKLIVTIFKENSTRPPPIETLFLNVASCGGTS